MKKSWIVCVAAASLALSVQRPSAAGEIGLLRRGDSNGDGKVNLSDGLATLGHLFLGGPMACADGADADDNGAVQLGDAVFTLNWLYVGGVTIPAPGAESCGRDPTPDSLPSCTRSGCTADEVFGEDGLSYRLSLPSNIAPEAQGLLDDLRITDALEVLLNSAGDSIDLEMSVNASVALVAALNIGGDVTVHLGIERTDEDLYEVGLGLDVALAGGIELVQNIEASLGAGAGGKIIFIFRDVADIEGAIKNIAMIAIIGPARGVALAALEQLDAVLDELARLDRDRRAAFETLRGLTARIAEIEGGIRSADGALRSLENELSDVLDDLAGIVADIFGFFDRDLKRSLERERDSLRSRISDWQRTRSRLLSDLANTQRLREAATRAIGGIDAALDEARSALTVLDSAAQTARNALASLDTSAGSLQLHGTAFELSFSRSANLQAQLSAFPGVSLAGMSIGVSGEAALSLSGRLDLDSSWEPYQFRLAASGEFSLMADAVLGAGVRGTSTAGMELAAAFLWSGDRFERVEATGTITFDVHAEGSAGVLLTAKAGAGRTFSLEADLTWIYEHRNAVWNLVSRGDVSGFASALGELDVSFEMVDRRTAGGTFGLGFSVAGYGAGAEGSAYWSDFGESVEAASAIGDAFEALVDEVKIEALLHSLAAKI
jgi:hypothetical protein